MIITNVQELEDRTLKFDGTLTETEAAMVVSIGLNTLWSSGLMKLLGEMTVTETPLTEGTLQ